MLASLAGAQPLVQETFIQASTILGYDLWQLAQEGPEDDLNRTDRTQPALLAAGVAVWRAWRAAGGRCPDFMAGHSLGEYTAWVCAGAFKFEAAVELVADRGRYMLEAVPQNEGAMVAVLGLSDESVKIICRQAARGQVVEAANFNAPGQVVIAGHADAVSRAVEQAQKAGAKTVTLSVGIPSHCHLMEPAVARLRQRLSELAIEAPSIPVVNNVDVAINEDPDAIRNALARQLDHPVRWVETIVWLKSQGVDTLVECGPGKILAGLTRRIDKNMVMLPAYDPDSFDKALRITGGA
jgi:[acyl-carrier-protein] S-malonyltransferase